MRRTSAPAQRWDLTRLDADGFEQAARDAEQACAVSKALRGNVQINLNAELEGG